MYTGSGKGEPSEPYPAKPEGIQEVVRMVLEFLQPILRALENMLACPAALTGLSSHRSSRELLRDRSLDDLEKTLRAQFLDHLTTSNLLLMSGQMQQEFRVKLLSDPQCMLPSFNHTLPSGNETGTFLALDVGGSTFRVALVSLSGRTYGQEGIKIVRITSHTIDEGVRSLCGTDFFDWMAGKISLTLRQGPDVEGQPSTLPIGLSWSFPIEQTSLRAGKLQSMGKGFNCSKGLIGKDLAALVQDACTRAGFSVRIDAIINDSSATLLSRAYVEPSTTMSLILGTGMNAAVHMPVSYMGREKFGVRDASWHAQAQRVITNTELSMFGGKILPKSRYDEQLNRSHVLPDFQPLEYMTTGRYLGEIVRLIWLDAVESSGLFGGTVPVSLTTPYSLDTAFLAILESDTTPSLSRAASYLEKTHAFTTVPSFEELSFLRTIAECVSTRAAAYISVGIHALWSLDRNSQDPKSSLLDAKSEKTAIACDGSVINKYPGFKDMCHSYLAGMISADGYSGNYPPEIHLETALEAGILGAAVAVAVCENESLPAS